jgi:hypothetical protein
VVAGNTEINNSGVSITMGGTVDNLNSLKFVEDGDVRIRIAGLGDTWDDLFIKSGWNKSGRHSSISMLAESPADRFAEIVFIARGQVMDTSINLVNWPSWRAILLNGPLYFDDNPPSPSVMLNRPSLSAEQLRTNSNFVADGYVNAGAQFRRAGTPGSIFVPVTPFHMTDTSGFAWAGTGTRNPGYHYFDANGNGNNLPTTAKAIVVLMAGSWSTANTNYILSAYPSGAATAVAQIRSLAANILNLDQVIVPTNASGDIMFGIAGATMDVPICRCVGYFV